MTLTTYPSTSPTDTPDLASLNLSRLLARLEHNLLSSNADLKSLRRSEYQRMRVGANIEYARATLTALERSIPQIKPVDRRHELQSTFTRNRQTLKRLQNVLDEIQSEAEIRSSSRGSERGDGEEVDTDDGYDDEESDSEDLLATPERGSTSDEGARDESVLGDNIQHKEEEGKKEASIPPVNDTVDSTITAPSTSTPASTEATKAMLTPTSTSTSAPNPTTTLRHRHRGPTTATTSASTTTATGTGTSFHDPTTISLFGPRTTNPQEDLPPESEHAEQETLTASLLTLATQLKTSSQAFQASLDAEKSVLSRAADGLDRATGSLQAAEKRMGMLRRMTEGKGWWGRMMLYAWIFALWVVAVLIVFVGPKLRF